jgi:hypothetical protein
MEVKFRDEGTAQKGSQQWVDGRVAEWECECEWE